MKNFIPVPAGFAAYSPHAPVADALCDSKRVTDLIPFGNNAPELTMRPFDYSPGLHPTYALAQLKVDGISAIYIQGKFWSLQGTPLDCCDHALGEMRELERHFGFELVVPCEYENGQFRQTISAMRSAKPGHGTVWAYDYVPYAQWKECRGVMLLKDRIAMLEDAFAANAFKHIGLLETFPFPKEMMHMPTMMQQMSDMGLEGWVIKDAHSTFKRDRSSAWLRLKVQNTFDGKVVGVDSKYLLVHIIGRGDIRVGVGMPADMREIMENDPMSLMNITVEVVANVEPGADSLRHCRFVRSREDKDLFNA